ncbi:MAG: hypothetical protein NTV03_00415 [Candidatus Nomurabacteria bacterium]|nr:hypothetical protein [Candidatus Nomurabacteria bacterium]
MKETSPIEQRDNSKISADREIFKKNLSDIFDNKETKLIPSIDDFIIKSETLQKGGLIFDKEGIINGLKESINIKDKEVFISHLLKVMEPILISRITQATVYRKIEKELAEKSRTELKDEPGHIFLSEFLYCNLEKDAARIHLAAAYDFITKDKINDFKEDIVIGLKKLAKIIEPMKNIDKVVASSWIIEKSPKRLKELGFTIEGEISQEEKNKHFNNDSRTIYKASIDREKFDELYLNK